MAKKRKSLIAWCSQLWRWPGAASLCGWIWHASTKHQETRSKHQATRLLNCQAMRLLGYEVFWCSGLLYKTNEKLPYVYTYIHMFHSVMFTYQLTHITPQLKQVICLRHGKSKHRCFAIRIDRNRFNNSESTKVEHELARDWERGRGGGELRAKQDVP